MKSAKVLGLVQLSNQYIHVSVDKHDYYDYDVILHNDAADPHFLITYNDKVSNKLSAERKGLYPYQEILKLESNNVSGLLIPDVMSKLRDTTSFEYAYCKITEDWWKDYVDCWVFIEPDEDKKEFTIYLNKSAIERIKEYPNSFPSEYNGFPLEYSY